MKFGSVCSGIEAASVAWHRLGWKAAWLSEIEAYASALLAHHYPDVPNLGDMTTIAKRMLTLGIEAPDILVGGTPCQAFSVAGLRKGITDARGQLTIKYVELANAIDRIRRAAGKPESIIVWENVPGVLSSKDNAFGCFLGGLAGSDCELQPAGRTWSNAGVVSGPSRTIAWRVLDAQYFGVAQRRRRVFVVASARNDFDPARVLFEFEGVRRDTAPCRTSGQEVTGTLTGRTGGGSLGNDFDMNGGLRPAGFRMVAFGEYADDDTASTMKARDYKDATDLVVSVQGTQDPDVNVELAHTLGRNGGQENAIAYGIPGNWIGRAPENGGNATEPGHNIAPCLTATDRHGVVYRLAVRRLMPVECERLQGFPDNYTLVPYRGKPASNSPRYMALGNSMAVPCMYWIGNRIHQQLQRIKHVSLL